MNTYTAITQLNKEREMTKIRLSFASNTNKKDLIIDNDPTLERLYPDPTSWLVEDENGLRRATAPDGGNSLEQYQKRTFCEYVDSKYGIVWNWSKLESETV